MSAKKNKMMIDAKAKILKALAHPTRLIIIDELSRGECCVCKLVELANADFSTVSKHLTVLKQAKIVSDEKRGQQVFYNLEMPCTVRFMKCLESVIKSGIESQMEMFE